MTSNQPEVLCQCGDRPAAQCPGQWEPGCDLGNNEAHVRVAAEQAEPVAVPAGYALVPVDRLKSAAAQAKVAADCIVGFAKDKPGKMCGWLDDACTAADTAAEMFSSILAAPPAPARQEPLTEEQIKGGLFHAIDHATVYEAVAFKKGVRFAERAHGITAAPAEGGASH